MAVKITKGKLSGTKRILLQTKTGAQHYHVRKDTITKRLKPGQRIGNEIIFTRISPTVSKPPVKPVSKPIKPVSKPVHKSIFDVTSEVYSTVRAPVKPVSKPVSKPIKPVSKPIKPVSKPVPKSIFDVTSEVYSTVRAPVKPVSKPVSKPIKPVSKPPVKPVSKPIKPVSKPIKPVPKSIFDDNDIGKDDISTVTTTQVTESQIPTRPIAEEEIVVVTSDGKGSIQTYDEQGNPIMARTDFLKSSDQRGLYEPVIDQSTGKPRTVASRRPGQPDRVVMRRTKGMIVKDVTGQSITQTASQDVQLVAKATLTLEDGTQIEVMGFSSTERKSPGGNREEESKWSMLKNLNLKANRKYNDKTFFPSIEQAYEDNEVDFRQKLIIH